MLMWISHQLLIKPSAHSLTPCLNLHMVKSYLGDFEKLFFKNIYSTRWTENLVEFFWSIWEQSQKRETKSSRSDTQPLWHLTSRRGWLGTSPSVTLWVSNGQTLLTCDWLLLDVWYTSGQSVYSSTDCVMSSQVLWPRHHQYWHFECVCTGVKYFPHREACFLLCLFIIQFSSSPSPFPFAHLHHSGRQSSPVLSSHLLFAHPSIRLAMGDY